MLLLPKATSRPVFHGDCHLLIDFYHVFQALKAKERERPRRRCIRRIEWILLWISSAQKRNRKRMKKISFVLWWSRVSISVLWKPPCYLCYTFDSASALCRLCYRIQLRCFLNLNASGWCCCLMRVGLSHVQVTCSRCWHKSALFLMPFERISNFVAVMMGNRHSRTDVQLWYMKVVAEMVFLWKWNCTQ